MNLVVDGVIELLQNYGGITVYFRELLNRVAREEGIKLTYHSYKDGVITDGLMSERGVSVSRESARAIERFRSCKSAVGDVFHSTYYRLPKESMSSVTTVHDFTYEKYVGGVAGALHSWQKYKAIQKSSLVVCISRSTANDLLELCPVAEDKIRIIYNGVSDNFSPFRSWESFEAFVLFVGARSRYKNFDMAVDAVALEPSLKLYVVGGGPLSEVELRLLESRLPGRYRTFGKVSDSQLNSLYNSAFCLLYPSSYEGFGMPVVEAMKAGCPVVAVNISSIPEVGGKAAILVDKPSAGQFHEALKALDNLELRRTCVRGGLVHSENFSWERCFRELMSVYKELS